MLLEKQYVNTDVLVVGGGLAGCSAALRAAEKAGPRRVLLVEKGHVRRSGNAATGVDHTWSYLPEVHDSQGFGPELLVEDHLEKLGPLQDADLIHTIAVNIADRIKEMETWGFPFKTDGKYRYVKKIHRVPSFLHWAGRDQKVIFAKRLAEKGVPVLNRVFMTDLIVRDGRVVGAIGIGVRQPVVYIFMAKAVILTTGGISRIYPPISSLEFSRQRYPYGTGDGIAMGIRAGAEVVRMEFFTRWIGTKGYVKPGRGTWIGVVEDKSGKPLGKAKASADRGKIDLAVESPADMIRAYREGRGPIYMNCTGISDDDFAYMKWGLSNEGNLSMLRYWDEAGIDPHSRRIEFSFYEPEITGGLVIDPDGNTNVPALFAAGGEVVGNMKRSVSPGSYTIGWLAGETAAALARQNEWADPEKIGEFVDRRLGMYQEFLNRREGASWKEASGACQDIMGHYGGEVRYAALLEAGLGHLREVRQRSLDTLSAGNLHELMRCLEALNLMEISEASMICALERKETRADRYDPFVRVDFPDENPEMRKFLVYRKDKGVPGTMWREPRRI